MKVGDKLYCKKTIIVDGSIYFIEDKSYTINIQFFNLYEVKGEKIRHTYTLDMLKDNFYTEKELRKLKLDKINKNGIESR